MPRKRKEEETQIFSYQGEVENLIRKDQIKEGNGGKRRKGRWPRRQKEGQRDPKGVAATKRKKADGVSIKNPRERQPMCFLGGGGCQKKTREAEEREGTTS